MSYHHPFGARFSRDRNSDRLCVLLIVTLLAVLLVWIGTVAAQRTAETAAQQPMQTQNGWIVPMAPGEVGDQDLWLSRVSGFVINQAGGLTVEKAFTRLGSKLAGRIIGNLLFEMIDRAQFVGNDVVGHLVIIGDYSARQQGAYNLFVADPGAPLFPALMITDNGSELPLYQRHQLSLSYLGPTAADLANLRGSRRVQQIELPAAPGAAGDGPTLARGLAIANQRLQLDEPGYYHVSLTGRIRDTMYILSAAQPDADSSGMFKLTVTRTGPGNFSLEPPSASGYYPSGTVVVISCDRVPRNWGSPDRSTRAQDGDRTAAGGGSGYAVFYVYMTRDKQVQVDF